MPSFVDIPPGKNPAQSIDIQQVIDALKGTAGKGVPIAITKVVDSIAFALAVQNTDATNSRAGVFYKSDGSVLLQMDKNGVVATPDGVQAAAKVVTIGDTGTVSNAMLGGSIANAKLATDVQRAHQLVNGGFEFNQRGGNNYAGGVIGLDRWITALVGTGAISSSGPDTTHVDTGSAGSLSVVVSSTSGNATNLVAVEQKLEQYQALRGLPVSVSFRVQSVAVGSVRGFWSDGVAGGGANQFTPAQATPAGGYTTYTFTFTPSAAATQLWVGLCLDTVATWYVDNAMAVIGSVPSNYVPLHPADDLARCLRYCQRFNSPGTAHIIGTGFCINTTQAFIATALLAKMGGAPTLTISAAGDFQIYDAAAGTHACTALTLSSPNGDHPALQGTVAAGLVGGNATDLIFANGTGWFMLEWNP